MGVFNAQAFQGKHYVVTGATRGIGRETAMFLTSHGAVVTATGRNAEALADLKQHAEKGRLHTVAGDLTKREDREWIADQAVQAGGAIDGLVNCAGITGGDTVENLQEDQLTSVMTVNYTAVVLFTQNIYAYMKPNRTGSIVNVSSLSGLRGTYGNTAYSASKFALIGFTQSFALEAAEYGIRVNAVCPGFVDTDMAESILQKKAAREHISYEEMRKKTEEGLPSKRITAPIEVAETIAFLLSDAGKNIVGESLKISGGAVMR
ncbi:SDR family NAD(P)-dependent oxidoreductase [Salisediminibacterium halotolerans]|uniref:3-oxoacyl-[acyl-carrier protein] reductase n=1 Tax=Salisediminibacterium halotolerans TaxID=517425 RepID=A0A1H9RP15_9BACI|nr:SDR family NAD(P)-dependent oxidoreductase [Salisediminibacterium haloalkalitolerans]SER73629.1 3-oxoacyl-[acyl-carrier protein] reductase [Salisediminibacterium haloalkalitolerans]